MTIELTFTENGTIRIRCGDETLEVPFIHLRDHPLTGATDPNPPEKTPDPKKREEEEGSRGRSTLPGDHPVVHGRPKPSPGVAGLVGIVTKSDDHDLTLDVFTRRTFGPTTSLPEAMISLEDFQTMSPNQLASAIENIRSNSQQAVAQPMILDVGVRTTPNAQPFELQTLVKIVATAEYGLLAIRLLEVPEDD